MMSSSLTLATLALVSVNVSCLPGPDPGAYYFSKTVWTRDKDAPLHNLKIGEIKILMVGSFFISIEFESAHSIRASAIILFVISI